MKIIETLLAPALLALVLAGSGCSSPPPEGAGEQATPAATESPEDLQDRDEQEDR